MPPTRTKSQYTETEAAEELGISITQLRTMIRSHVVDRDEDLTNVPVHTFQASDLVILRLLTNMQRQHLSRVECAEVASQPVEETVS